MSPEEINGDDLSLGVSQSATVIRMIVKLELLGDSLSTEVQQPARSDFLLSYHFERVRLRGYRHLEYVRLPSSGRILGIVLADQSFEVNGSSTIFEGIEFGTFAFRK